MTKKKAKRHMAPYMKYVPKMSNLELKNFLMVSDTMKEHVQLNAVIKGADFAFASEGKISAFMAQGRGPKPIENASTYTIRLT